MKKTGEILKNEREKRKMSLHEIGMSLKINPKILKAIEEGDLRNLPAKTFLRGFVRSYAQYLRIDVDEILKVFQDEMGTTRPETPKPNGENQVALPGQAKSVSPNLERTAPQQAGTIDNITGSNHFYMVIGSVFLLVVIIFVVKMLNKYQKETITIPAAEISEIEENILTTTTLAEQKNEPVAHQIVPTISTTSTTIGMSTVTTSVAPTTTRPALTATTTRPALTATTTRPALTATTTTLAKAAIATSTTLHSGTTTTTIYGPTTTSKPPLRSTEVIVEALNKVTISYQLSYGKMESIDLNADQVHTFKSKGIMTMEISDGGSVSIIVNGRDRGVPGAIGKPLKLKRP